MRILDSINSSEDVKGVSSSSLYKLAEEIREFLIQSISETGGHLASNLGVVELTIALHRVFQFPKDKIIFDVGHQSYVHKILTGRKDNFNTLRKLGGMSGFPKVGESEYDCFDTGHSSNSLSVAIGMKRAYNIFGDDRNVIAVLGDGSFVGGMVYEAINDAGQGKENIIVILNDNQMSISKNKSSISRYLSRIRINSSYLNAKNRFEEWLSGFGVLRNGVRSLKNLIKRILMAGALFEDLGFKYYGPYDGHNIEDLEHILTNAKKVKKPVIIHILTKKGKGYNHAEADPVKFHGISQFNIDTGERNPSDLDYSKVFGEALTSLAERDDNIVAVTAAMPTGTGLDSFKKKFRQRFFDVGICEQHAVSMCGGMAAAGLKPVFAVYSSFLQRGFDQIITDVALMKLHVVFGVDRAGLVGEDGETHQGVFDIAYLNCIPNLTVMSPASFDELRLMLDYALFRMDTPVAIRYPRGGEGGLLPKTPGISLGRAVVLHEGADITIVAEGRMVTTGLEVCRLLRGAGISAELINIRFIKPLDTRTICESVGKTGRLVVLEEGVIKGGLGESVYACVKGLKCRALLKGVPDMYIPHGTVGELMFQIGLTGGQIVKDIKKEFDFEAG